VLKIKKDTMEKLEKGIPVLICKLEKIFPPGWFNLMQHLLVHIPYEVKVGSPVQYKWMYHIEKAVKYLRSISVIRQELKAASPNHFFLRR
jgi:hypothetical protein